MDALTESRTLADALRRQADHQPDAPALIFEGRTCSYAELARRAGRVAQGIAAFGVRPGDRVGYLGKNVDCYFELLFGAANAGAVLVPVNWRLAPPEIAAILTDAGITILFVGHGFRDVAVGLEISHKLRCVSIEGANTAWPDFAAWRDSRAGTPRSVLSAPADTVLQMYTSGTTGLPKGVELTNKNFLAFFSSFRQAGPGALSHGDVVLVCMPVFHVAGTNLGLAGLTAGASVVIMEEYEPGRLLELIARHRVSCLVLVPAAILMLVQCPAAASADLSSVRILLYGASPIAEALQRQTSALFRNARLFHLYGLTEACGAGTILPSELHDPALGKLRSCGRPYPGFELCIVDPMGKPLPNGEIGEIVIRSETVMRGYWNNPDATRAAFFEGGWLRTGDAAYMDEDGLVYVHDRVKDMIVTGAENVYPAEVENALYGHPAIADVAVIGVPDPRWGEAVKAIVVLQEGQRATAEELIAHARQRIAGYKLPKSVDFVAALPRNPTGKVLRRALRAPYWEGRERQVS